MRNFNVKKYVKLFICLTLIICFISGCYNNPTKKSSTSSDAVNNFLEENHASVDISKDNHNNGFSIMDSDIKKNNVILTGEGHAVAKNYEVKLALLKHLNQKDKISYLLAEIGYSSSCYINEYLESGDESKLKLVYNNVPRTFSWSKDEYNSWIELRKYNLTVPENQRIKVIGIDIEQQIKTAYAYLNSILPSNSPPNEIRPAIEQFTNSYNLKNDNALIASIENLQSDIKSKSHIYNSYFGSKYFDFSIVVDNIVNFKNTKTSSESNFDNIREPLIYSNFKRIYSHFPTKKYFGEFGMEHVYQRSPTSSYTNESGTRFAMYLNSNDSPVKGKVLSIAYGYEDCYYMNVVQNYTESKAGSPISNSFILDKYSKTDITIFKLNGNNSPFNSETYFVKEFNGGYTTDYFKYIIFIKNSKGTIPLGKL